MNGKIQVLSTVSKIQTNWLENTNHKHLYKFAMFNVKDF